MWPSPNQGMMRIDMDPDRKQIVVRIPPNYPISYYNIHTNINILVLEQVYDNGTVKDILHHLTMSGPKPMPDI